MGSDKKSVLVIENDHETRVKLRRALEDEGHFVVSVTTGAEALTIADKISRPDLIILATSLPTMSGAQCLALLRSAAKGFDSVPAAQIQRSGEERIFGTCSVCNLDNLSEILGWLKSGAGSIDLNLAN